MKMPSFLIIIFSTLILSTLNGERNLLDEPNELYEISDEDREAETNGDAAEGTSNCRVGDIIHENGEYIGVIGTTCSDDDSNRKYKGTQSKCVNGVIIDEEYSGDCNRDYRGSKCCQEGKPGDFGAAVCIKKRDCIPYDTDPYDWQAAKEELERLRGLWKDLKVNKYVYSLFTSCFCGHILIEDDTAIYGEFDKNKLEEHGCSCSDEKDIETPVEEYYNNIDYLYDKAIGHAEEGIDADCSNIDPICGGGIEYEIHDILLYPMKLNLIYGHFIAGGVNTLYTVDCLTVYEMESNIDLTNYNDECNDFVLPTDINQSEPTPSPIWIKGDGFRDRDYILFTWKERMMSWLDAEQFCINTYDSHLGSMISIQDWERQYDYSYHGGFNGLNDFDENGQWQWIDGTQCEINSNKCSNQVDFSIDANYFCSRIPWGGFITDQFPCHQPNNQFFCNKVRGYHLVRESKSYGEAEDYCQTVYGTHLATIERSGDMENANYALNDVIDVWLGLYYVNDNNLNVWLDGTEYVDANIINIDLSGNSNCKSLHSSGSDSIIKADNGCSMRLPFLCNKRRKVREYILERQNATFDEGREICETKYETDLATVVTEEEFSEAMLVIPYFGAAWIGLQRNNNDEFVWVDGTQCSESNANCISYWNEYAPLEPVFDCGGIWQNGRAETANCGDKLVNVLCNKPLQLYEISDEDREVLLELNKDIIGDNIENNINNNWMTIGVYIGVLTIVFNVLILVLKNYICNKNLYQRKEKYMTDL